jgi:hypothetical protein
VSSEQWKLPDRKLNYVAQKISNWYGVGLNLDISADELDVIEADMCKEHPRRKVFEMLRLWRDLNHSMFTESDLRATLRDALSKVSPVQTEAIEELNNDANQVPIMAAI